MKLCKGKGNRETRGCWMAALSVYANEKWSDHPACVPPTIRRLCIALNDMLSSDEERERIIGPHLFLPIGADPSLEAEQQRAYMGADRAVRVFAVSALNAVGLNSEALKLQKLSPIVSAADTAAYAAARAAADAADAADTAAYAAAYDAARAAADAADAAAYAAAYDAADAAAYAAAYAAADATDTPAQLLQLIIDCCRVGQRTSIDLARAEETQKELAHWG